MRSVMLLLAAGIVFGLAGSALAEDEPGAPEGPSVEKERPGRGGRGGAGGAGRGPGPRRGPPDRDRANAGATDIAIPDALKERLMSLSPEQRRQMMDRLQRMTPEQRREMFKRLTQARGQRKAPDARRPERPARRPAPQTRRPDPKARGQETMFRRMMQQVPEEHRRGLMERFRKAKPEDRAKLLKGIAQRLRGRTEQGPQAQRGPQARRGQQHGRRGHPGQGRMSQRRNGRGHPTMQRRGLNGRRMQAMQRFPMLRRLMMMRRGGQQRRPMMHRGGQQRRPMMHRGGPRQGRSGQHPAMQGRGHRGPGGGREAGPPRGKGGRCPHCGRGGDDGFGQIQAWWRPVR